MLKDGSDSVGALGALNRVYLNIGLYSEEWLRHFNPILGGRPVTPIEITAARANSSYWQATEMQTPDMALFLLKASYPHKLKNAPGGNAYLNDHARYGAARQDVFADNCARCHSSKAPDASRRTQISAAVSGRDYLGMLEPLLEPGPDRRLPHQDAPDRRSARFPRRQLPVERRARAGDVVADQRLQPARDQCASRQHLGQFLVGLVQIAAVGRHDHGLRPVHRQAAALQDAGRRPRLHPRAVAGQRVVDRALSAQQQRREIRGEPVGRRRG